MPRASEGGGGERDERNSVVGHRFSLMPGKPMVLSRFCNRETQLYMRVS